MSIMDNVQPVVKKETGRVSAITGIGLLIMWIVFGVLHAFMLWVIIAIVAPCFHFVAGIVPLLFPGTGIKIAGIFHTKK